jgi:hypothetical protein
VDPAPVQPEHLHRSRSGALPHVRGGGVGTAGAAVDGLDARPGWAHVWARYFFIILIRFTEAGKSNCLHRSLINRDL